MKNDLKKRYFAAANTSEGFVSYYNEVFGKLERLYVIKGGPGTGKSRLMNDIGAAVEINGRDVEYFYCSFDYESLDGIIIDRRCAVIDGTAPHVYEPRIPGAIDETVDLSRFWNADALHDKSNILYELNQEKSRAFGLTYLYLSALGRIYDLNRSLLERCIKRDSFCKEMRKSVNFRSMEACSPVLRLSSSFGKKGIADFSTYRDASSKTVSLSDKEETLMSEELLSEIMKDGKRRKVLSAYSYAPLEKNKPNALMFSDGSVVITSLENADYDVSEFMRSDIRHLKGILKENGEIKKTLLSCAQKQFEKAASLHMEIEKIYVAAMDFDMKEKFTQELTEKIICC